MPVLDFLSVWFATEQQVESAWTPRDISCGSAFLGLLYTASQALTNTYSTKLSKNTSSYTLLQGLHKGQAEHLLDLGAHGHCWLLTYPDSCLVRRAPIKTPGTETKYIPACFVCTSIHTSMLPMLPARANSELYTKHLTLTNRYQQHHRSIVYSGLCSFVPATKQGFTAVQVV